MAEPTDPTRTGDVPAEPPTATDHTRSHDRDPATATADSADRVPTEPLEVLPGFDILRELGSGGMGVVYEARQTRLNRLVALKVLRGGRGDTKDMIRFLAEAEAVAAIRHPHVVQVYETGQDAGRPYMVLELLTGGTLADRLKAGKLDPREAAALVAKLAGAVEAAHELGIVHRDLKPSNVLFAVGSGQSAVGRVTQTAPSDLPTAHRSLSTLSPKVTDFGLAKRAGGVDLTRTQAVMGTPAYMAPEQARGDTKFVGPAADIWALGAILYECLTGKRPFHADETFAILRKVMDESPPRPRTHVPSLPRDLELIALKCLEKSPADRYPSAAALADDLQRYLAGKPVSVRPAGSGERFVKWVRRNPGVAGATTAVALALVAGTAVSLAFGMQARKRGEELAKSNDDLTSAQAEQEKVNKKLRTAYELVSDTFGELAEQKGATEERGYLSDVALAHQLWKANDLAGMRAALERCPPARRKWEWHYLDRLSRPEKAVYSTELGGGFGPDAPGEGGRPAKEAEVTGSLPLALAYSPDGKLLASVTHSGSLGVRDTETGKLRFRRAAEKTDGRNRALAFRPDGKTLAFAAGNRLWVLDLETGVQKEIIPPKRPDGTAEQFSYVALGYAKDTVLLGAVEKRDAKTRKTTFTIRDVLADKPFATLPAWEGPEGIIAELGGAAFSPDGTRFAASAVDSGVRAHKAGDPAEFEPFRPVVMLWEVESKKLLARGEGGSAIFGSLAFSPDGRGLRFGGRGRLGGLEPSRIVTTTDPDGVFGMGSTVTAHAGDVLAVALDKNGLVWSAGEDKFIRAHDRRTDEERFILRGCPSGVVRLAVSPDGKEVAAAVGEPLGGSGSIIRFDVAALAADSWRTPAGRESPSTVVALAPDGSRFAAIDFSFGGKPGSVRVVVRDTASGAERKVEPAGQWLRGVFRPGGGLVVPDRDNKLRVIGADGNPGEAILLPADADGTGPPVLACSPDGKTLAAVTVGRTGAGREPLRARLSTWSGDAFKPAKSAEIDLASITPPNPGVASLFPTGAAIDRGGKRLAAVFVAAWQSSAQVRVELRGVLVVWDLASGTELFRRETDEPLHAVALDAEGRVVAGGGAATGGVVRGWDAANGKESFVLRGHTRPVIALAFGPDGRLATGGMDRVVKLWAVADGRELLTFDGFAREVTHLAFAADGKNLVAGTGVDVFSTMTAGGLPAEWPPAEVRVFRGPK